MESLLTVMQSWSTPFISHVLGISAPQENKVPVPSARYSPRLISPLGKVRSAYKPPIKFFRLSAPVTGIHSFPRTGVATKQSKPRIRYNDECFINRLLTQLFEIWDTVQNGAEVLKAQL